MVFFLITNQHSYSTNITLNITGNTTWSLSGSPYVLQNNISIDAGVTLTIQAGVEVQLPANNINLFVNGTLLAQGTSGSHVVFTGPSTTPIGGTVRFNSNSSGTLSHTEFNRLASGFSYWLAAVFIDANATVDLNDCSFDENEYHGLRLIENANVTVTNCSFQNGGIDDVHAHPSTVGGFSDNTLTEISFYGSTINNNCTWPIPGPGVRYTLYGDISVAAGSTLTIASGVEIFYPSHTPDLLVSGTLLSQGTAGNPVVFHGPATSSYGGTIRFYSTGMGTLTYTEFTRLASGFNLNLAAMAVDGGANVSLDHCSFTDNEVYGLAMAENAIATVTNCDFQGSGTHDVFTHPNTVGGFSHNSLDEISFYGSIINNNCTWPLPGTDVRYSLYGDVSVSAGNTLTIDPGVQVYFVDNLKDLLVTGTLDAQGNDSTHIVFKGPDTGLYAGSVTIYSAGSATISYADFTRLASGFSASDAAFVTASDSVSVSHCSFIDNQEAALRVNSTGAPQFSHCDVKDNKWGMYVDAGEPVIGHSNIYDNMYGIHNIGPDTVDARGNYWGTSTGPYHPGLNPGGTGNEVSNRVLFDPWSNVLIEPDYPCDGTDLVFPSGAEIIPGAHRAENTIQAAGNVIGEVIFNAGNGIELLANFEVFPGGELIMEIKDCVSAN